MRGRPPDSLLLTELDADAKSHPSDVIDVAAVFGVGVDE